MSILHFFLAYTPDFRANYRICPHQLCRKKVIYKTKLTLPKQPVIISFTLPVNAP